MTVSFNPDWHTIKYVMVFFTMMITGSLIPLIVEQYKALKEKTCLEIKIMDSVFMLIVAFLFTTGILTCLWTWSYCSAQYNN